MIPQRTNCPMRHENGNCLPAGGFCTAVSDPICEALHNAYYHGTCDMAKRPIILSQLDAITDEYHVVNQDRQDLGEKAYLKYLILNHRPHGDYGYLKPAYDKRGRRNDWSKRYYEKAPAWLKYEVIGISRLGGLLTFHVREPEKKH